MAERQVFWFVAGEQVQRSVSRNVLDAFLAVEIRARYHPVAAEFHSLPIEVWNSDGELVATRTWDEWHDEVIRDTYGSGYKTPLSYKEREQQELTDAS